MKSNSLETCWLDIVILFYTQLTQDIKIEIFFSSLFSRSMISLLIINGDNNLTVN